MKNLEGRELFGIKLGKNCKMEKDSWQDYFEVIDDDDDIEMLLKLKETFSNDFFDDGNEIEYNFYLEIYNGNIDGEEAGVWAHVYLMPKLKYIHESVYKSLVSEYNGCPKDEWIESDILRETQCPLLINKEINIDFSDTWYHPEMDKLLETATQVLPFINRIIGFYMDKYINRIGTTNWDCLESLMDGSDWTHQAIERFKEANQYDSN